MNSFSKLVSDKIDDYVYLRRSLGYAFVSQAQTLKAFRKFVENSGDEGSRRRSAQGGG